MNRFLPLALLVCFPLASNACLNDRDSDALAVQNNRFPDAMRVITGRFERNPPRFYQMRIARVERELKSKPRDFALYDDLAVAHDKLGDDETALKIMAQKRALLPVFNSKDKANKEAWYRFFANDGTFRAHRFLKSGAKVERIGEMKRAREEIKRALQIKPNAHFGRERVQLMVMDWTLATKKGKANKTLGEWIEARDGWDINDEGAGEIVEFKPDGTSTVVRPGQKGDLPVQIAAKQTHRRRTAEGLAGLIVLGAAWQSPDVFQALAQSLDVKDTVALRFLVLLRCRELLQSGHKSLAGLTVASVNESLEENEALEEGVGINKKNEKTLNQLFWQLRNEADTWSANRAYFMESKFAQNKHPDTDARFWDGWKNAAPPSLDVAWFNERASTQRLINNSVLLFKVIVFGVPALLIAALVWFRGRRAKRKTSLV